jgi:tRNA (guanine-N7-)-methyltransferase
MLYDGHVIRRAPRTADQQHCFGLRSEVTHRSSRGLPSSHTGLCFNFEMETQKFDHVRSFVKRKGHFSDSRKEALNQQWPVYGLEYEASTVLDFAQIYDRVAPVVLEIGFGMGITTAEIAQNNLDTDYLGVEVYSAGVASLMKLIGDKKLTNIRAMQHDVFEVARDMLPDDSISAIHIFFPDPWPKARHHKRRLVQPEFVQMLRPKLKKGGYIHCATDWQAYAEHMLEVLVAAEGFANNSDEPGRYCARPNSRPLTKFEDRGLKLGHGVWDLIFRRVE